MNVDIIFVGALFVFAAASLFAAFFVITRFKVATVSAIEKIPRNITLGVIFGTAAITWCVPQAIAVFSASSVWGYLAIAIICLLVGCFFLDYLFARAFAGFSILLAHYFLYQSFAAAIPILWLFSLAFLAFGTFGIVIGGVPHLLRDLIRKACLDAFFKKILVCILAFYAVISAYAAIVQVMVQF